MADTPFTIAFTDIRLRAVQAIVDEWNTKNPNNQITVSDYFQLRANQLADLAIYEYNIPPTQEEYQALLDENKKLKDELGIMKAMVTPL